MKRNVFTLAVAMLLQPVGNAGPEIGTSNIHLKLPEGMVSDTLKTEINGDFKSVMTWQPNGGKPELLFEDSGDVMANMEWTLNAGFASEKEIGLSRTSNWHITECWHFTKDGGVWKRDARGDISSRAVRHVRMTDARTVVFERKDGGEDEFTLTDHPIASSGPLSRVVLMNGKVYWPYGKKAGGPTAMEDLSSLEAQWASSKARLAEAATPPEPKSAKAAIEPPPPRKEQLPNDAPAPKTSQTSAPQPQGKEPTAVKSHGPGSAVAVGLIVASVLGLAWMYFHRRKPTA